jgi:hypothetical protein
MSTTNDDTLGSKFYELFGELDKNLDGRLYSEAKPEEKEWLFQQIKNLAITRTITTLP